MKDSGSNIGTATKSTIGGIIALIMSIAAFFGTRIAQPVGYGLYEVNFRSDGDSTPFEVPAWWFTVTCIGLLLVSVTSFTRALMLHKDPESSGSRIDTLMRLGMAIPLVLIIILALVSKYLV